MVVFWWSAVLHEVAVGVPFRMLKGWAFLAMFGQASGGRGFRDRGPTRALRHPLAQRNRARGHPLPGASPPCRRAHVRRFL